MRLFEPKLYAFVRNHSERLTGAESDRAGRDERSAFGDQLLANVEPDRRKRAERALCYLFPRLDAIFANTWRGHDWARAERERRITSPRRFPIYFNLGLGDGILSADDLVAFRDSFQDPERTRTMVRTYRDTPRRHGGTRAAVLLDAITSEIDTMMTGDQEQAARALLAAADLFLNPADDRRTANGLPRMWAVSFAIEPFFRGLAETTVAQLIGEAIEGPSPLTAAFFVTIMAGEHGRGGEKEAKPEDERRLSLEHVERLEQRLIDRVVRDAASGDLIKCRDAASLIWWWKESAGPAPVRSWIDANLDTEGFAPWLMATFTNEGMGQAMGDMVGQRIYTVNRDSLSKLVDVDRLSLIAERRIASGEDLDQTAAHFVAGLKSRY